MRGIITLATAGGGLPPRNSGGGGKGEASFENRGGVSFKGGSSGGASSSVRAAAGGGGGKSGGAIFKSAVTCASLGVVGDIIAQSMNKKASATAAAAAAAASSSGGKKNAASVSYSAPAAATGYDFARTARQCAYNFVFYGPLQHFWYAALAVKFPMAAGASLAANFSPFAIKVFLNQAVLGPIVVSTFFAWSMSLQGQMSAYFPKLERDLYPTLQRGWKFWIPAASVNFAVVPVRFQVLYMSCCSIVWNYILSQAAGMALPEAQGPAGGAGGKKKK